MCLWFSYYDDFLKLSFFFWISLPNYDGKDSFLKLALTLIIFVLKLVYHRLWNLEILCFPLHMVNFVRFYGCILGWTTNFVAHNELVE